MKYLFIFFLLIGCTTTTNKENEAFIDRLDSLSALGQIQFLDSLEVDSIMLQDSIDSSIHLIIHNNEAQ